MRVFTVHVPVVASDRLAAAEKAVLLPEAFSWGAFWFGPLWFAVNRAWIGLAVNLAAILAIVGVVVLLHPARSTIFAIVLLVASFVGLEARQLMRLGIEAGGYRAADVVVARDSRTAEQTFFQRWLTGETAPKAPAERPAAPDEDIIGMFPEPETRG